MIAPFLAVVLLIQTRPATVTIEPLPFDVAAFKAAPAVTVKVSERGTNVAYKGVPLRLVLADKLQGSSRMADLRALSDAVLLVRAGDGYQVSVAAAGAAMDEAGNRYLLAYEQDGQPLTGDQGPFKLIVPGDSQHVRWIRGVETVDLVRMPPPEPVKVPAPAKLPAQPGP